jgi:hypothetical protein
MNALSTTTTPPMSSKISERDAMTIQLDKSQKSDGDYPDFIAFLRSRNKTVSGRAERGYFIKHMLRDADAGLVPTFRDWPHLLEWMQQEEPASRYMAGVEWRGKQHSDTIEAARLLWHRWHRRWLAKLREDLGDLY